MDARGEVLDGDAILYLWARDLRERDELPEGRIVATSMSNIGLERALDGHRVAVERCDVGDRAVVETLRKQGLRLGGEQSGHIVDLELTTTGDGLLTAIQIASLVARSGSPLHELAAGFRRYPQVLKGVEVREKVPLDQIQGLPEVVESVEDRLGAEGRLVLRYSGTEPLARVMLEGPDQGLLDALCEEILDILNRRIGVAAD